MRLCHGAVGIVHRLLGRVRWLARIGRPRFASVEERQWRGSWWRPDEAEHVRSGTFRCTEDGGLRLELIGGFDTEVRDPLRGGNGYSVRWESREFPIIHGQSGNDTFTLLGNIPTSTIGGSFVRNITEQDWHSNRALQGIHLRDTTDRIFTANHLQIERLLAWSNLSTLALTIFPSTDGQPLREEPRRQVVESLEAIHGDIKIGLGIWSTPFHSKQEVVRNRRSVLAWEEATLTFETDAAVSHNEFEAVGKAMQDLLTLASYTACGVLTEDLEYRTSESYPGSAKRPNRVSVLGRRVYRTKEQKALEAQHHQYLFTLADCDFREIVPKWLDLKERARLGCDVLFGQRYISNGYVGSRLLAVASAAESIHGSLRTAQKPLEDSTFRSLRKKVKEAIQDEPEAARKFVLDRLQNQPNYQERLLDLASIPDQSTVDELLTDRNQWATMLKRSRNDLAHANPGAGAGEAAPSAYWLLEVSYALLSLVLMAELGLPPEVQKRALEHPQIDHAKREFAKHVTAR